MIQTGEAKTEVTLGDASSKLLPVKSYQAKKRVTVTIQSPVQEDSPATPARPLPNSLAAPLRAVYALGACISPGFGIISLVHGDPTYSWAWSSLLFWMLSQTCSHIWAYSNPPEYKRNREIVMARVAGLLVALPGILAGAKLRFSDDFTETWFGFVSLIFGAFFSLVLPMSFPMMTKEYGKLSRRKQHNFVIGNLLKGSASILGTLVYISAAATRCIQRAEETDRLLSVCGNPIIPSFVLTIFLFWTWLLTVLVPPLVTSFHVTWNDIARLELPKNLATQGAFYGVMSLSALVMFAQLNEDGEKVRRSKRERATSCHYALLAQSSFAPYSPDYVLHTLGHDGLRSIDHPPPLERPVRRAMRKGRRAEEDELELERHHGWRGEQGGGSWNRRECS